mgnify:CR=1 FL=1
MFYEHFMNITFQVQGFGRLIRIYSREVSRMAQPVGPIEADVNRALDLYADMVRRICFLHLKQQADVEDVFQDVFLKYMQRQEPFDSGEQ